MIAVGALGRLLHKHFGRQAERFQAALLAGEKEIVSAEPARLIAELGRMARPYPKLVATLREGSPKEAAAALACYPALAEAYQGYLSRFGERCSVELKLQSATLSDDPTPLLRAIGNAAASSDAERKADSLPDRQQLEAQLVGRPLLRWAVRLPAREARHRR